MKRLLITICACICLLAFVGCSTPETKTFSVSFDTGFDYQIESITVKDGDLITPPVIERTGYTLDGWTYNDTLWDFTTDKVTGDIRLTAKWTANQYTLSFDTGIDETIDPITVTFNEDFTLPTPSKFRLGYEFDGWLLDGKPILFGKWTYLEDYTLTAKWTANQYTLSFDTGCDEMIDPITLTFNEDFILPTPSERDGYKFEGWLLDGHPFSASKWIYTKDFTLTAKWTDATPWDDDGVLKILTVGNSFSVDSMEYVYQIAKASGIKNIKLGNLYIGSCTIYKHLTNAKNDTASYTYYTNNSGSWTTTESYKLSTAVKSENWDFISFQQSSTYSGQAGTYDDLNKLVDIVKPMCTNKKVSFVWHMTWAYQGNSTHSGFSNYNNDQTTMYNAIISATQSKIVNNSNIDKIVPNGTAIQTARTSYLGDTLTRDGYHLSYAQGRVIASLTMLSSLVDVDLDKIDLSGVSSNKDFNKVAIESTKNALKTPFAVTKSVYEKDPSVPDYSNYTELNLTLHRTSYWQSVDSISMYTSNTGTALKYWATDKLTKEDLPVGSIIVVASGWRYRPEGWVGDNRNKVRPDMETISVIEITEEWWGDFTYRAFNIGKTSNGDISNLTETEIRNAFKIYIPKK